MSAVSFLFAVITVLVACVLAGMLMVVAILSCWAIVLSIGYALYRTVRLIV